jgi:type III secretion system YscQ/HrcQ family protein
VRGEALPLDVLTFLVEAKLEPLWQGLEEIFGLSFYVDAVALGALEAAPSPAPTEPAWVDVPFELLTPAGDMRLAYGRFSVPLAWLAVARLVPREQGPVASALLACPALLSIVYGRTYIASQELRSLEVGSWIRIEECAIKSPEERIVWVISQEANRCWSASFDHASHQLVITGEAKMENVLTQPEDIVNVTSEAQIGHGTDLPTPSPLEWIEVKVDFEIGRLEVPLAELARVTEGHVFELNRSLDNAPVRIKVNGREIARGELVAVGDTNDDDLIGHSVTSSVPFIVMYSIDSSKIYYGLTDIAN